MTGSYYDAANEAATFCFDCEIVVPDDRALCYSCEAHRAHRGGHEPEAVETEDGDREWCHGAGPEGLDEDRLFEPPRGLRWSETRAYVIQPKRRRRRRRRVPV